MFDVVVIVFSLYFLSTNHVDNYDQRKARLARTFTYLSYKIKSNQIKIKMIMDCVALKMLKSNCVNTHRKLLWNCLFQKYTNKNVQQKKVNNQSRWMETSLLFLYSYQMLECACVSVRPYIRIEYVILL